MDTKNGSEAPLIIMIHLFERMTLDPHPRGKYTRLVGSDAGHVIRQLDIRKEKPVAGVWPVL